MFIDPSRYSFLQGIREGAGIIRREFDAFCCQAHVASPVSGDADHIIDHYSEYWVRDNGFHPEQIGFDIRDGAYTTLAIFKAGYQIRTFDAPAFFPQTLAMIGKVPNLAYAAFFVMHAGSHLRRHAHSRRHLIYHLLLNDLDDGGCEMHCGDDVRTIMRTGDEVLFDYSLPHESFNRSNSTRVNLVVDFFP